MVAIAERIACRFQASWSEGQPVRESFHATGDAAAEAGIDAPRPPAEVLRVAAAAEVKSPELRAVLSVAYARRLPSVYDPDQMSFSVTTPIYLDHVGVEVGRLLVIRRDGDTFTGLGWVHPDHAEAARQRGHVSPGIWIEDGAIVSRDGADVLVVSRSQVVELSAVAEPARPGTSLAVSGPQAVPSPDWEALVVPEGAFARFSADYDAALADRVVRR